VSRTPHQEAFDNLIQTARRLVDRASETASPNLDPADSMVNSYDPGACAIEASELIYASERYRNAGMCARSAAAPGCRHCGGGKGDPHKASCNLMHWSPSRDPTVSADDCDNGPAETCGSRSGVATYVSVSPRRSSRTPYGVSKEILDRTERRCVDAGLGDNPSADDYIGHMVMALGEIVVEEREEAIRRAIAPC
jgi:hypothetical protein